MIFNQTLKVDERYKFPRGVEAAETRERIFGPEFTAPRLNRIIYPYECVDGWYVISAVKLAPYYECVDGRYVVDALNIIPSQVVVTFGRVNCN